MKKKVVVTSIIGFVLMAAGILLWMLMGTFIAGTGPAAAKLGWDYFIGIFGKLGKVLPAAYTPNFTIPAIVMIAVCGVMLILWIVHLVLIIKKKRGPAVTLLVVFFLEIAITYGALTLFFLPGYEPAFASDLGPFGWLVDNVPTVGVMPFLAFMSGPFLFFIGWIIALTGLISDLVLLSTLPKPVKPGEPIPDEVLVIRDGEPVPEEIGNNGAPNPEEPGQPKPCGCGCGNQPGPQPTPMPMPAPGFQGPILVQYINTYAPEKSGPQPGVPVSEIQGAITGEKPLSADEIRKIIKEEMAAKEGNPQPVIVNVPSPVEPEAKPAPKGLTAEEVREIFSQELDRYLGQTPEEEPEEDEFGEGEDADIIVEEEDDTLTADDVRQMIADSFADMGKKEEEEPKPEEEKPESFRDIVREELAAARAAELAEAQKKEDEERAAKEEEERLEAAKKEAVEEALRQREEEAKPMSAEDIRAIVAEELAKANPEQEKSEDIAAMIREVIRETMAEAKPVEEEKVVPTSVIVEEPKIPTVNIIVKQEAAPEPQPEPEPEPEPEPAPAPAPEPKAEDEEAKEKIVRIPFPTRMLDADKELRSNYNELKSEILSYGVKSRVSNTGDTFRLHKVTFVKITIAGKALKLYFALNPADYASTTYPIQDAGHKGTYKDIPLVFKVKSELSLRRAKQLIADVMEKNDLEQGKIEPHNWAAELKDYKPSGSDED